MNKIITYSFCESFIDRLVDHIEENYLKKGQDLSRLAVVFGGRRPALFVNRELAMRVKKSFYPPKFFTIDGFIHDALRKKESFIPAGDLDSCYLLYRLAQGAAAEILEGRETFAKFLPWSRKILSFIDQLDLEHVDGERLMNIQANAEIGYDVPEDINRLLEHIVLLRRAYHEKIQEQKIYSRGFQYLRAAGLMDQIDFSEFDQILFCNFFYFNRCEERIVQSLYDRGKATLIFQGDERKWPALERVSRTFSHPVREGETPRIPEFHPHFYSAFDGHSQVGQVREILKNIEDTDQTVVVVPDADHLIPLLSETAGVVKDFNVSMGYPLKRSSLYSLCAFVFRAQLSRKSDRYYAKDYLRAIQHPFVKNLHFSDEMPASATRALVHKIEEILTGALETSISGNLFIRLEEIAQLDDLYLLTQETTAGLGLPIKREAFQNALEMIHKLLFTRWEGVCHFFGFSEVLGGVLDALLDKSFLKNYPLNLNIVGAMYAIRDELRDTGFCREEFPPEEIFKIFEGKVAQEKVAFHGSPLKGLQILGLQETRSLNFKNVIILDVNEGVLPRLDVYEPLIPREVMVSLNLDRLELEEEIQRYQFMRLISSAENVHLVYQEGKDKEKSRFLQELIWEEQKRRNAIEVYPVKRAGFEIKITDSKTVIPKTAPVLEHLRRMRYSASSLNTYLRNPLEFYYSYVLGLREQDDLLDEPQARHVGTFIHELLEEGFKPFLRKKPNIDQAFRNRMTGMFEERFEATLARSMKSDAFMLKAVIAERLNRFLDNEQFSEDRRVQEILCLESRFEDTIPLSCAEIRFSYVIDRVDRLEDGTRMIIDYKTGGTDQMPKAIDRIAAMELSRESIRDNIRSFQIPLYFYYLEREFKDQPINAALYNLRTLELKKFISDRQAQPPGEISGTFLRTLDFVVSEILNPEIGFESDDSAGIYMRRKS